METALDGATALGRFAALGESYSDVIIRLAEEEDDSEE
jgi:hypothetical protein